MDPHYVAGDLQASAGGFVEGFDPSQPTTSNQTQNGPTAASASAGITNGVYGTLGVMGSDGKMHGGHINVSVTESGMAGASYGGPIDNPGSSTLAIEFVNSLQTTSTVQTDGNGNYGLNGASGNQITGGSSISTDKPYHYNLRDANGNPPAASTTMTIGFSLTMDKQLPNFFLGSSINFTSSHLDVILDVRDAGGGQLGLHVWDPSNGHRILDNTNFTDGTFSYQFTVPAPTQDTINYSSTIASYPLGYFSAPTTSATSHLGWTFSEAISHQ